MNKEEFNKNFINPIKLEDYISNCYNIINCYIIIDDNEIIFRDRLNISDITYGSKIMIDSDIYFIKRVMMTKDGSFIKINTYSELENENRYKDYLENNLYYELPNDEYATFYTTDGYDYKEIYNNGLIECIKISVKILSYLDFKNSILEIVYKETFNHGK